MTTETKTDNTAENTEISNAENVSQAASNKAVFGPLGKYAVAGVIMVSVIVTTAIMMNRELGTVEDKIASIEEEVSEFSSADATGSEAVITETAISANAVTDTSAASPAETTPADIASAETAAVDESDATVATVASTEAVVAVETPVASTEGNGYEPVMQARQEQMAAQYQARIEAYKQEQKQHMTEMFDRIKTLEAQQLDQYKSYQESHVERLREQIAIQQKMIDDLISRNKELYELRAAKMQQHQTKREEMINRI